MDTPPPMPLEPIPPAPEPPSNPSARQWKVILHASAFATFFLPTLGNVLGPLLVWLIKKEEIPSLEPEGRKVINFQISFSIYGIASVFVGGGLACLHVPILLPFVVAVLWLVFTIMGTVKASNGESYDYPLSIKFL